MTRLVRSLVPLIASSLFVVACGSAPVASRFQVDDAPDDHLLTDVERAIVAEGFDVEGADARVGVVRTAWTTVPIGNMTSATHRRYTIMLRSRAAGTEVLVRGEFKHCAYTAPPGTTQTSSACTRTGRRTEVCDTVQQESRLVCEPIDAILADDQQDLDAFAAHVQESLGGTQQSGR